MNEIPDRILPLLVLAWKRVMSEHEATSRANYTLGFGTHVDRVGNSRRCTVKTPIRHPKRWRAIAKQMIRQVPEAHETDLLPGLWVGHDDTGPVVHPLTPAEADAFAADPDAFLAQRKTSSGQRAASA